MPPSGAGLMTLTVRSLDRAFDGSAVTDHTFRVSSTAPTVTSDVYRENGSGGGAGVPGTFTFAPKVKGVASYTYSFNGDPEVTVPAGAHHSARVRWTPPADGFYDLTVRATTRSGAEPASYDYYFTVD